MSVIDEVLQANELYSQTHELRKLTPRPERKLAVLTCMDTRLSIRCVPWWSRTTCWGPRNSWLSITPIAG
jgi:hypothetical protein